MSESEYIKRNGKRVINVHESIHAFAMALGRKVQEEESIRKDKVIKKAILRVFKNNPECRFTFAALIQMVSRDMDVPYANYIATLGRIEAHIKLNSGEGGYLKAISGQKGGIFRRK